jgi:hypothetical protein
MKLRGLACEPQSLSNLGTRGTGGSVSVIFTLGVMDFAISMSLPVGFAAATAAFATRNKVDEDEEER